MERKSIAKEHYYSEKPKSKVQLALIRTYFRGRFFEFLTCTSVFSKKRIDLGTRLLVESMILPKEGDFLDLGCGYGPVGIAAAKMSPGINVVMTDVNERAVWLAKENLKRNRIKNGKTLQGFMYEPVESRRFKTILSNPPVSAGMEIVTSIIQGAPSHLTEDGWFQLVVRSRKGGKRLFSELEKTFGNVEVLARRSGYRVLYSKNLKTKEAPNSKSINHAGVS